MTEWASSAPLSSSSSTATALTSHHSYHHSPLPATNNNNATTERPLPPLPLHESPTPQSQKSLIPNLIWLLILPLMLSRHLSLPDDTPASPRCESLYFINLGMAVEVVGGGRGEVKKGERGFGKVLERVSGEAAGRWVKVGQLLCIIMVFIDFLRSISTILGFIILSRPSICKTADPVFWNTFMVHLFLSGPFAVAIIDIVSICVASLIIFTILYILYWPIYHILHPCMPCILHPASINLTVLFHQPKKRHGPRKQFPASRVSNETPFRSSMISVASSRQQPTRPTSQPPSSTVETKRTSTPLMPSPTLPQIPQHPLHQRHLSHGSYFTSLPTPEHPSTNPLFRRSPFSQQQPSQDPFSTPFSDTVSSSSTISASKESVRASNTHLLLNRFSRVFTIDEPQDTACNDQSDDSPAMELILQVYNHHQHDTLAPVFDVTGCVICLGEMEKGERVRELVCGHMFHVECVDEWIVKERVEGRRGRCPICVRNAFGIVG
ncbi:hypothetical protein BC829DRAFT_397538 [Chytridium lagenaria]|nr:hypothetical protein BC829DRAFT_397538 [Chytridium lagenaria]